MSQSAARLVSVNVGLPREITWQGRTVFTGIWKEPVAGPRTVRRLNVDGDGQGDLNGSRRRAPGRVRVSARLVPVLARADAPRRLRIRSVRRELHGRRARRRRGLHRRPIPHRLGTVRGQPAAGHLLPARHPDGRAAHARAARRARPTRLLPSRPRGRRSTGRRRRAEDRARTRGDDGRRCQRAALPGRSSRRRATPARAAHPGAQPGLAGIAAGAARRGARGLRPAAATPG